jgi:hypothetical protein
LRERLEATGRVFYIAWDIEQLADTLLEALDE